MAEANETNVSHDADVKAAGEASDAPAVTPERELDRMSKPEPVQPEKNIFPVVGLGASAGGLKSLQQFFERMPADNGMAFVVIMHLSPQHESHAAEILQNSTRMPVMQVNERVRIEPNKVYVIPPTKHLSMQDGHIALSANKRPFGRHVSIDLFFRTLADSHTTHAACVVLSGTGSDGSVGLKQLKEQGGIAIAQDPHEAEYDAMPRNAIATNMVDFVLPVAEMPNKLIEIWRNSSQIKLPAEAAAPAVDEGQAVEDALRDALKLLRARTGHDFAHYKRATVLRRIERRMQVTTTRDLPAYRDYLRENPPESQMLLKDLLIGVTNFFRDRDNFDALEREVVPPLFEGKSAGDQVRVWCAGCSTGEEAYSVAVLLLEHAALLQHPPEVQVFATDIDEEAIAAAREGTYPTAIETDVAPSRLRQFFTKEAGGYRVNKDVRECVLFAPHNLIKDPPFSKLDLITCRNLLIYLDRGVQERVFELFHFALRANGFLFLGSSESVDGMSSLFPTFDAKHRLFRADAARARGVPSMPFAARASSAPAAASAANERKRTAFGEVHQRLLEQYAPPSVIVNANHEIVHLSDRAGRYIQHAGGEPSLDLLKVVLPEMRLELRTVLYQALRSGRSTEARRVHLKSDGRNSYVNMTVRPMSDAGAGENFVLIIFDEVDEVLGTEVEEVSTGDGGDPGPLLRALEEENLRLKEQLQATTEQYETSVEESNAANAELQAINEELRSTSEELETSKEELQSVNEELRTVNDELKHKIEEVSATNNDLQNLISSTDIATVFLDRALRIKRFTPPALDIFNLIPADEGRELTDITHRLDYPGMTADADEVLRKLHKIEREVASRDGRTYLSRIVPYRTADDRIDGVVLAFVDVSERRRSEERLRLLIESARDYAIMTIDAQRRVNSWSPGAEAIFGYAEGEIIGQSVDILFTPEDRAAGAPEMEILTANAEGRAVDERWHVRRDGSRFYASGIMTPLLGSEQGTYAKIARDLTEQKHAEERFKKSHEELDLKVKERTSELSEANESLRAEVGVRQRTESARTLLLRRFLGVQEEERRHLARELHDQFGQQLIALKLNLDLLRANADEQANLRASVDTISAIVEQLDADIDFLTWELRPTALDDLGLKVVLDNYVTEWSRHNNVSAQLHYETEEKFAPEIEITLYRIVQEALNNVSKHAAARAVSVILERRYDLLSLIIEDNGRGFDTDGRETSDNKKMGLTGMRERAILVGGTVDIESRAGAGTTVFVRIPVTPDAGEGKNARSSPTENNEDRREE